MRHAIKSREDRNSAQSKVSTSSSSTDVAEERVVVGFGPYKNMSFFDLFHSPEDAHKKYVKSILQIHISHPGGQMDKLKNYIQTQQRVAKRKQMTRRLFNWLMKSNNVLLVHSQVQECQPKSCMFHRHHLLSIWKHQVHQKR